LRNLVVTSAGKYVDAMCPRWISPFAYGNALVIIALDLMDNNLNYNRG